MTTDRATTPHDPDEQCGQLHCYIHHVDEPDQGAYRSCFECRHVYRTADELLAGHNKVLAGMGLPAETDAGRVHICAHCTHDL